MHCRRHLWCCCRWMGGLPAIPLLHICVQLFGHWELGWVGVEGSVAQSGPPRPHPPPPVLPQNTLFSRAHVPHLGSQFRQLMPLPVQVCQLLLLPPPPFLGVSRGGGSRKSDILRKPPQSQI